MAYPAKQKTWTITPNNQITFVSLVDTMGNYLKGMADFLLANGYTCKGSSDGTTGAMDAVNRWTTVANASVLGANTSAACSWMVLTDANGCDISLAFIGASDDIARFAFSPGGLYVAAGTPTFQPTATDELVLSTGVSVIDATASLDRLWNGWVDSESKLCRFCILRDSALVGMVWGVELVNSRVLQTFSPAVWGFAMVTSAFIWGANGFPSSFSSNSRGGRARANGLPLQVGGGGLTYGGNPLLFGDTLTGLQGASDYPMYGPLNISSVTLDAQGPIAYVYDWWTGRTTGVTVGSTYDAKNYVQWGNNDNGLVWPWDGATTPVIA